MAKMKIDEQVAAAERKLRELKRKQLEQHNARKAERYDILVSAMPGIAEYDDGEYAAFVQSLARDAADSTEVDPEPSKASIDFED